MIVPVIIILFFAFFLLITVTAPPLPGLSEGWLGYTIFGLFLIASIAGWIHVLKESKESDVLSKIHSGEHVIKSANGDLILSGKTSVRSALNGLARKCLIDFSETDSEVVVTITALGRKKLKLPH